MHRYEVRLTYTTELGIVPLQLTMTVECGSEVEALRAVLDLYEPHVERLLGVEIIPPPAVAPVTPDGVDEMEAFVTTIAQLGLDGECETHETCDLDRPDCVAVPCDVYQQAELLAQLIRQARQIVAGANL